MEHHAIGGIVWREEFFVIAGTVEHVGHNEEEPTTFQHQIGIDIDEGVFAEFYLALRVLLYGKLVDKRTEIGGIVFREISGIGTQFHTEYAGNLKLQVEVGEDVQLRQGQHVGVATVQDGSSGGVVP